MKKVVADVVIIGTGPAGLATSLALSKRSFHGKVVLLEIGRHYTRRFCPVDHQLSCSGCGGVCNVLSGFGGSIHYGDGVKLSRFPSGRRLAEYIGADAESLENEAVGYLNGQGPLNFTWPEPADLPFPVREYPVAVISAAQLQAIIRQLHSALDARPGFELHFGTTALRIEPNGSTFEVIARDHSGALCAYSCRHVVVGAGRAGFLWWRSELRRLGLPHTPPTISIGLRFECPAGHLRNAAAMHADFKTSFNVNNAKIKTFCFCADSGGGGGRVKFARYPGFTLLDGHVITEATPTANFGLLVQMTDAAGGPRSFEWLDENILKKYEQMRSDRSGKPVVQWYPDFRDRQLRQARLSELLNCIDYRPSVADVEVADLASLVGDYHEAFCTVFERVINAFGQLNGARGRPPSESFLVYGLEVESVWDRMELSTSFETPELPGLYVVGDCAGIAQGILQAMVTGVAAGRAII
jgi:uncharacterized FAD-dependent dehydrogenase